jgi:protoheme IX farnesyltransferase
VGGWAAASGGTYDASGAWILFAIMFFWQVPHVTAIAWMYLDDYKRADFIMLPRFQDGGLLSSLIALFFAILLLPLGFLMSSTGVTGSLFAFGTLICGIMYLAYTILFVNVRNHDRARKLLFASIFYLPLVWVMLIVDYFLQ